MTAMDYEYAYARPSQVTDERIELSTFHVVEGRATHPWFFEGRVSDPRTLGLHLLWLSNLVRTRFYQPFSARLLDAVVTSSVDVLRFEGFSSCCGVYARVDLDAAAFDLDHLGRGTTNVDFGDGMRAALAGMRARKGVSLAVGREGVAVAHEDGEVVERRVKLPVRWLKGFGEVQGIQRRMRPAFEVSGAEALRFVRGLKPAAGTAVGHVVPLGRGLRWTTMSSAEGVRIQGVDRIRFFEPLLRQATALAVHAGPDGSSAWEVRHALGRTTFVVSPEPWRGFSGEGQVLEALADEAWASALPRVRAQLAWRSALDPAALAEAAGVTPEEAEQALVALGAQGLVGFDLSAGRWFHRELPFDLEGIADLQPRLLAAREIVADGGVREADGGAWLVRGTDVEHHVRLGDRDACTCTWWARHRGERGPCRHVLAARLVADGGET